LRIVGQLIEDNTTIRIDLMFVAHEIREQNAPVGAHLAVGAFVPLMPEGFDFNTPAIASKLTGNLSILKQYHGPTLPAKYFKEAMTKLREKFLE
jgi:hypothetical protein